MATFLPTLKNLFQNVRTGIRSFFDKLFNRIIPNPYKPPAGENNSMRVWVHYNERLQKIDGQIKALEVIEEKTIDEDIRKTAQKLIEKRRATRADCLNKRDNIPSVTSHNIPKPMSSDNLLSASSVPFESMSTQIERLKEIYDEALKTKDTELEELSQKLIGVQKVKPTKVFDSLYKKFSLGSKRLTQLNDQIAVLEEIYTKTIDTNTHEAVDKLLENRSEIRGDKSRTLPKLHVLLFSRYAPPPQFNYTFTTRIRILTQIRDEAQKSKDKELETFSQQLIHTQETERATHLGTKLALGTQLSPIDALKKQNKELMERMQSLTREMCEISPELRTKSNDIFQKFDEYQNEEKQTPNPDLRVLGNWVRERQQEADRLKDRCNTLKRENLKTAR